MTRLRAAHPVFRRRRFFHGRPVRDGAVEDIAWLHPDGRAMRDEDWSSDGPAPVAVFLNRQGIYERDPLGEPIADDSFLLLFNPTGGEATFTVPESAYGSMWHTLVDTSDPCPAATEGHDKTIKPDSHLDVGAHTVLVLRCPTEPDGNLP